MAENGISLTAILVIAALIGAGVILLVGIIVLVRKMSVQETPGPAPAPHSHPPASSSAPEPPALSASLDEKVRAALRRGNKIDAIREVRMATDWGLKEAKEAVEAFERGEPLRGFTLPAPPAPPEDLHQQIVAELQLRRKINAIKLYREATGAGLREAKDAVEEIERGLIQSS